MEAIAAYVTAIDVAASRRSGLVSWRTGVRLGKADSNATIGTIAGRGDCQINGVSGRRPVAATAVVTRPGSGRRHEAAGSRRPAGLDHNSPGTRDGSTRSRRPSTEPAVEDPVKQPVEKPVKVAGSDLVDRGT
jgi:hypothetical protein